MFIRVIAWLVVAAGFNSDFVDALPVALRKPLSGGAAKGMMIETIKTYGLDSFTGWPVFSEAAPKPHFT